MASIKSGGTVNVFVNGIAKTIGGKVAYSGGGVSRTSKTGLDGKTTYTETPQPAHLEVEFMTTPSLSLVDLGDTVDAVIVAVLGNGRRITMSDAWYAGDPPEGDAAEGTVTARFECQADHYSDDAA